MNYHKINAADAKSFARTTIRDLGLSLPRAAENDLVEGIADRVVVDPETRKALVLDEQGAPMVAVARDGAVVEVELWTFIAQRAAAHGLAATAKGSSGTINRTARAVAIKAAQKASDAKMQRAAEAASHGNPWQTGNRTHQAIITNNDPALASRLRAQGVR